MKTSDVFRLAGALDGAPIQGPLGVVIRTAAGISQLVADILDRHGDEKAKTILTQVLSEDHKADLEPIKEAADARRKELEEDGE